MGIRRKKITDRRREKIEELLTRQDPRQVYEVLKGTRDQVSVSTIYKIRRQSKQGSAVDGAAAEQVKVAEHEHKLPEEVSHERGTEGREKLIALVQQWREEVATYSPVNLLQGWLNKAHEDAQTRFYANEDVEMLYSEARKPHDGSLQVRPFLEVENDSTFGLLREKFPASNVWVAFQAWCEQKIPYVNAFYNMLKKAESAAAYAIDTVAAEANKKDIKGVDWIDGDGFPGFAKRCKMERLLAVLGTCDLLACGIAKRPSNPYWAHLSNDLEELRLRVSVELSTVAGITRKGGWSSGIMDVRAESPDLPLELTEEFLDELAKLRSMEDSLVKALKELEGGI